VCPPGFRRAAQAFEVLQLPPAVWGDADAAKAAYRRLSVRWHPDKNPGDAARSQALFVRVAAAYHTLTTANFDYKRCAPAHVVGAVACVARERGSGREAHRQRSAQRRGAGAERHGSAPPARGVRRVARGARCTTHRHHAHEPHATRVPPH
jgi:curved DNA-binding protein CbpA